MRCVFMDWIVQAASTYNGKRRKEERNEWKGSTIEIC